MARDQVALRIEQAGSDVCDVVSQYDNQLILDRPGLHFARRFHVRIQEGRRGRCPPPPRLPIRISPDSALETPTTVEPARFG